MRFLNRRADPLSISPLQGEKQVAGVVAREWERGAAGPAWRGA